MNTGEVQHILSRLCTEEDFRNAFIYNKESFFRVNKIDSPESIAFFSSLSPQQLNFFSKGLVSKRRHSMVKLIPATAKIMGEKLNENLSAYLKGPTPRGIHIHHEDALHFIDFLFFNAGSVLKKNSYFSQVASFEKLLLLNFLKPFMLKLTFHSYDPLLFHREIVTEGNLKPHARKKSILLWRKGQYKKIL